MPIHSVVTAALRERIVGGQLAVGDALPSESELCAEFGSSRGPVRQALATLRGEGLISTSQGKVPVVIARPLDHSIDDFFSFSAWVQGTGRQPGQHTIEIARRLPTREIADKLGIGPGEFVVDCVRLRTIDGQPVMLERSSFIESVGRELFSFDTDAGSIYGELIERGFPLDHGVHTIDAVAADELDAAQLDVPLGTPLVRVVRITSSDEGQAMEYADDRYRADRAKLTIRNSRTTSAVSRPSVVRHLAEPHLARTHLERTGSHS